MSMLAQLKGLGPNGFGYRSTAEQVTEGVDLTGKRFLLTGCNSGLGLETLRVLGLRGAEVVALARAEETAAKALDTAGTKGTPVACDLSEPASVRSAVETVRVEGEPLDGIICNAGIMALPKLTVKHGLELQFLTNHMGHFLLVTGLLETLADPARVVVLSSSAHQMVRGTGIDFDNLDGAKGYSAWKAYGRSKLANLLFAKGLAKRFEGSGKTANALHPGVIRTNLGRHMNPVANVMFGLIGPIFLKSIPQGAATQCYLAAHPDVATVSGEYFADVNPKKPIPEGEDDTLAERLWTVSEELATKLE